MISGSKQPSREKIMDIAKLAGVDAVKLVLIIVEAAGTVRHNKTCQQLVQHVQIIGELLKKLLNELEEILAA